MESKFTANAKIQPQRELPQLVHFSAESIDRTFSYAIDMAITSITSSMSHAITCIL